MYKKVCANQWSRKLVYKFLSTIYCVAPPFHHKPGTIRNFLKTPPFFRDSVWCPGRWRQREPWNLAHAQMFFSPVRATCIVAKCVGLGPRTTNTFYISVWQPRNPGYWNVQCIKHTLVSWNIGVLKLICKNQRTSWDTLTDKHGEEPGLREKQG